MGRLPAEERPKDGVDLFLGLHADQLTVLERGYQVIVQRTSKRAGLPEFTEGFRFARTPRNFLRFLAGRSFERPPHGRHGRRRYELALSTRTHPRFRRQPEMSFPCPPRT